MAIAITGAALAAELIEYGVVGGSDGGPGVVSGGNAPILEEGICASTGRTVCAKKEEIRRLVAALSGFMKDGGVSIRNKSDEDVVAIAVASLKVVDEASIWSHSAIRAAVGPEYATMVIKRRFKPTGPAHSTALLTNVDIDSTLAQWASLSTGPDRDRAIVVDKFYHMPFQMIDFAETGSDLAQVDLMAIKAAGYGAMGVVINTDRHRGPGKHWFCLYVDLGHDGTETDPITLEYFNSSGNPPASEISDWLEQTSHKLLRDDKIHAEIVRSAARRLQQSHTECGVWSLLYIRERLEGKPPTWYYDVGANDNDMISARARLFR
jgi:hypothetical protein